MLSTMMENENNDFTNISTPFLSSCSQHLAQPLAYQSHGFMPNFDQDFAWWDRFLWTKISSEFFFERIR